MNPEAHHPKNPSDPGGFYRYVNRVEGHLDVHWSERLQGMTVTHEEGGTTVLEGALRDQSALPGLLGKLGDLHLPIPSLQRREPPSGDGCSIVDGDEQATHAVGAREAEQKAVQAAASKQRRVAAAKAAAAATRRERKIGAMRCAFGAIGLARVARRAYA
jgi:hypothetical protein